MTRTIVVVASGPSLTMEQISMVRSSGVDVMVVNDNYKLVPDARYLFAADLKWWYHNFQSVPQSIDCYTLEGHPSHLEKRLQGAQQSLFGVPYSSSLGSVDFDNWSVLYHGGNSGLLALQLCARKGYEKIIMIGFDHQHTNGKAHWFGDHDKNVFTINAKNPEKWVDSLEPVSNAMSDKGLDLVNCSLDTAIESVRRSTLEKELDF